MSAFLIENPFPLPLDRSDKEVENKRLSFDGVMSKARAWTARIIDTYVLPFNQLSLLG